MSDDAEMERLVAQVEALSTAGDDCLVLSYPCPVDQETCERLRRTLMDRFPGRQVLVLDYGGTVHTAGQLVQLRGIERSLASLSQLMLRVVDLLEQLQPEPEPTTARTLDGDSYPSGERDTSRPL